MKLILKNVTDEVINLSDIGISLYPNSSNEIDTQVDQINKSEILFKNISDGKIVVNNFERDLLPSEGILLITQGTIYPKDSDGKMFVHQTSRIPGCMTYWTGRGDDPDDPEDVGNGEHLSIQHKVGDPLDQIIYLDFNCIDNKTYLHEGYIFWKDAIYGDYASLIVVTNTVQYEQQKIHFIIFIIIF